MTISRHQAGAVVAGEKTGGQFKAGARTDPDGGALGQVMDEREELAAIAKARWAQYNRLGQMQHAMEVERVRIATEIVSTKVEELFADDQGSEISQLELMVSDHDPGSYVFAHLVRANGERVSAGTELQEIGALVDALDFTIAATPVEEDADGRPLTHLFDVSAPDAVELNRFVDAENLDEPAVSARI